MFMLGYNIKLTLGGYWKGHDEEEETKIYIIISSKGIQIGKFEVISRVGKKVVKERISINTCISCFFLSRWI